MIVVCYPGVPEDLDKSQVGVDFLCPTSYTTHPWPRYRDPPILHPRNEDTAWVGNIIALDRAVHESSQCWEIGLDLSDDTGQTSLSEVVNICELRVGVPRHSSDVHVEVHAALLKIGAWKAL